MSIKISDALEKKKIQRCSVWLKQLNLRKLIALISTKLIQINIDKSVNVMIDDLTISESSNWISAWFAVDK